MTAKMSPTINNGTIKPVEALEPKANAMSVTLKMDIPLRPALETPIRNAAVAAKAHEATEIWERGERSIYPFWSTTKVTQKDIFGFNGKD